MNPPSAKTNNSENSSPLGTASISATIEALKARDEAGLGALYDRASQDVYAYALSVKGNKDLAEDVVEETFWLAWEWIETYSPSSMPIERWLLLVAGRAMGVSDADVPPNTAGLPAHVPFNKGRSAGIKSRLLARAHSHKDGKVAVVRRTIEEPPPRQQKKRRWVDTIAAPSDVVIPAMQDEVTAASSALEDFSVSTGFSAQTGSSASTGFSAPESPSASAEENVDQTLPLFEIPKFTPVSAVTTELEVIRPRLEDTQTFPAVAAPPAQSRERRSVRQPTTVRPAPASSAGSGSGSSGSILKTAGWLVFSAAAAAGGYFFNTIKAAPSQLFETQAAVAAPVNDSLATVVEGLKVSLTEAANSLSALTAPDTRVINLMNYSSRDPLGRVFWEQPNGVWNIRIFNLRQPKAGFEFVVWAVASNPVNSVRLGRFSTDSTGVAAVTGQGVLDKSQFVRIVVSEELIGVVQDRLAGPIVLAGN